MLKLEEEIQEYKNTSFFSHEYEYEFMDIVRLIK